MKTIKTAAAALAVSLSAAGLSHAEEAVEVSASVDKIAATVLSVSSLDDATAFYTSVLGMKVVRSSSTDTYTENILASDDAEGTKLVLIESIGEPSTLGPGRVVFYTSDAAAIIGAMAAQGLDVEREAQPISEKIPVIIGIAHDADGHTLEFIQR